MKEEIDEWDYITKEDEEVMQSIKDLNESKPEETKIVTDYMEKMVKFIDRLKETKQLSCLESWCASRHYGKGDYCYNCKTIIEIERSLDER